jgi:hypothetical protein
MGGKGGFGRQLKKMGREFRIQQEIARKQKNRTTLQQQNTLSKNSSDKDDKRKNYHKASTAFAPLQGIYRDLTGKRIVVVDKENLDKGKSENEAAKKSSSLDEAQLADSAYKQQQVEDAANQVVVEERRNLVQKTIAAVKQGARKLVVK